MGKLPSGAVTFCFTDIEGSTQLFAKFGTQFLDLLETHRRILREAVKAHGGAEVKTEGDGFFFAFGNATEAVQACVEFQRKLTAHPWPQEGEIRVRVGLHSGVADPTGDDYLTFAVHEAARVSAAAHGGQTVVSRAVVDAVDSSSSSFSFRDLGEHTLKDLHPMRIYQVCHPELPAEFPPLRSIGSTRGYLPASTSNLVGRERDLDGLSDCVARSRMVTVVGAGGVGKTRLAVEAARAELGRRADGVWFVDLASVTDPERLDDTVLRAVGVIREAASPAREQLLNFLREREVLLVLDNCEHLVEACTQLVAEVLAACPRAAVLATSRENLGIDGETMWRVRSLDSDESVELFIDRARQVHADLLLEELARAAVLRIVERLDGIPLAIELAAARMRTLSASQIADRLDDRFRLLTGGNRTALARQRTLEAAVDWSYDLLEDAEKTLIRRLSVFRGGFDLEAAEAVWGDDVLDLLERLVDKSMVMTTLRGDVVRYRLLETIRHYGWAKLLDADEVAESRERHMNHYARLVASGSDGFMDSRENAVAAQFELDHDNIRAAVDWAMSAEPKTAWLFIAHLWMSWSVLGHTAEGLDRTGHVLELEADIDPEVDARAHMGAAHLSWLSSVSVAEVRSHCERVIAWSEKNPDHPARWLGAWALTILASVVELEPGSYDHELATRAVSSARGSGAGFILAHALLGLATNAINDNRVGDALGLLDEALSVAVGCGSISTSGEILENIAWTLIAAGDVSQALDTAERAVAAARQGPNVYFLIFALLALGRCKVVSERLDDAAETYLEGLELAREHGLDRDTGRLLIELGWLDAEAGRFDLASNRLAEAQDRLMKLAPHRYELLLLAALAGHSLSEIQVLKGDFEGARPGLEQSRALAEGLGMSWVEAFSEISIGWLELSAEDDVAAEIWFRRALVRLKDPTLHAERQVFAAGIRGLAGIAQRRGQLDLSARLSGAASESIEPNNPAPRLGTILHKRILDDVRTKLGDDEFEREWSEGVRLGLGGLSALEPSPR